MSATKTKKPAKAKAPKTAKAANAKKPKPDAKLSAIEAAGSVELLKETIPLVRPEGTIAVVAFYERIIEQFDIDELVFSDVTLRPVSGSLGMYKRVLRLMASGMLDLTSLITGRYPLLQAQKAMGDIRDHNETRIKIMLEAGE